MKINPLKAFANPASKTANPALNIHPTGVAMLDRQNAIKQLGRAMQGKKK